MLQQFIKIVGPDFVLGVLAPEHEIGFAAVAPLRSVKITLVTSRLCLPENNDDALELIFA